MTEQEIELELRVILQGMLLLVEESELELKSIQFLGRETNKIMRKSESPNLSDEEKQTVNLELIAMGKRLEKETELFEEGKLKLQKLEDRFDTLEKLSKKDSNNGNRF